MYNKKFGVVLTEYKFGPFPQTEFETGLLKGFDKESYTNWISERAEIPVSREGFENEAEEIEAWMYEAAGIDPEDEEYCTGSTEMEGFALVGLTIEGHSFWILTEHEGQQAFMNSDD
jgi:hypothetical protein